MSKDTICKYPFNNIAIKEYDSTGQLRSFWPCCMMGNQTLEDLRRGNRDSVKLANDDDLSMLNPEEIFNHTGMESLRNNLLNGVRDPACNICWEQEDRDILSFRQISNQNQDVNSYVKNKKLRVIDMSINNHCNLRCRMCTPSASSLLMLDHNYFVENNLMDRVSKSAERWTDSKLGSFKLKTNKQWQWIVNNTDKFEVLRLSGGEPFYNSSVLEFIDKAISDGTSENITLEFHTNATLFNDELIEKLSHFQNNLNFSIDGTGKVYEFIRYPATWQQLDTSVRSYMAKIPQKFYNIANIMMISNVFNLPEFIAWLDSLPGEMSVSYAEVHSQTRGMSLINLSKDLLEQAYAEVEAAGRAHPRIMVDNALNIIQDSINNNVGDKNKALEELKIFDMSRDQNYKDYLDTRIVKWLES